MEKQVVLVINSLFDSNMLIVKTSGSETIIRFNEEITPKIMKETLASRGVDLDRYEIHVVGKDWQGNAEIKSF